MNVIFNAVQRRRLVLAIVTVLALIGLAAWLGMDRQEDPFFPYRYGHVLVPWPGAQPEQVQRLIVQTLEDEIAQVEEINEIRATARLGFAHLIVGMQQHVYDTDAVWDRIRVAVERAERRFPQGAGPAEIRDRSMDTHGIVLAITGSDDLLELLDAARQLRRDLFRVPDIGRIEILANPGEQLVIATDDARLAALGLDQAGLAAQLAARNQTLPGGSLSSGDRNLLLRPGAEFASLEELRASPIRTASGALVPLETVADIRLMPETPTTQRMWHGDEPAIGLGIVIPENRVNAVRFGEQVRHLLDEVSPRYAPLEIHEMFYQPDWVRSRLAELGRSLLTGVVIVAIVLLLFMGPRLGLLVAVLLPLVTLSSLAVYAMGGGVLHQMTIAGMVIALGMLVDNAIVMVENLQWHLDRGKTPAQAATIAVRELAGPLAAATGTTLAAFTPLLLSTGDTADFTRGIPIMVMLVLIISYLFAIFVTPVLAAGTLKPLGQDAGLGMRRFGEAAGTLAMRHPWPVLAAAGLLLVVALGMTGLLQRDFFPSTDRNQMIVDLHFPEGTRTEISDYHAGVLAQALRQLEGVEQVHHMAGFSGPRFYYNLIETPRAPHLARIVVITDSDARLPGIMRWVRRHAPDAFPEAQVVARRLGQGPPIEAPVELHLYGEDADSLSSAARNLVRLLRDIPGATDVRHRLGDGMPTLAFEIDDAEAARHGIAREHIARTLSRATLGEPFSHYRAGREPVPMLLRTGHGEYTPESALAGLQVETADGKTLPLAQFVTVSLALQPAVIEHRDLRRKTAVLAETAEGVTYGQVIDRLERRLDELNLPPGVELVYGGAAAEAGDANTALFSTLPIGLLLLLVFLLWQFNSFRLVLIVLATVPLAAIGVVPGLILTGQPFSFTAILGVVALVGIVVNNAIVLIDVIGANRHQGLEISDAIVSAVGRRIRPILLTTMTTIAGLLPLTFTQSTLWPPMAWAIISGLLSSALLTPMVIPVLYRLLMQKRAV